ncbi:MAG TPA: phosphoglycerate mutase [Rudaea sp.]|nr:phosphoglycerate mutase [Rudaea sp.]
MADLTLLLPPLQRREDVSAAGALALWVARGDRLPDAKPGRDAALRECFDFVGTEIPIAALTRSLDANDAAGTLWLRADPAWVIADAVTVRLMACGNLQLSRDESDALARALRPLFGDAGFLLEPTTASRWYLRCPPGAQLPLFSPPDAALGDDIGRHLPEGSSAARWQHLLNEAQVMLHNHAVNAERVRRGAAPANSLWFWGPGKLPDWVRTTFTRVASDDDIVRALAQLANVPISPLTPVAVVDLAGDERAWLDLGAIRDPEALTREWLEPIQAALARGLIGWLTLHFASGERYRYRHRHRWRFWRRIPATGTA